MGWTPRLLQSNKEFLKDSCSNSHSSGPSQKRLVQGTQICVEEAHWLVSELGPGRGMLSRQVSSLCALSLPCSSWGETFFLTLRFFLSLILFFIFPSGTIYLPVLLPCSIQRIPFFFLLLNSRPLFLPFFYWSIIATQCYASFCRTMQWISYPYTYIPSLWTSLPPTPAPPPRSSQSTRAELPVLSSSFQLAVDFTHGGVYMSMPLS